MICFKHNKIIILLVTFFGRKWLDNLNKMLDRGYILIKKQNDNE